MVIKERILAENLLLWALKNKNIDLTKNIFLFLLVELYIIEFLSIKKKKLLIIVLLEV